MTKLRKVMAFLLSLLFIMGFVQVPSEVSAEGTGTDTYIKIRYNNPEGNYEGWNVWAWEEGKEGQAYEFIGEDEEGKFVVVKASKDASKLGFVLRRSVEGNDWQEKYFEDDKFIELGSGDKEVIIEHKESNRDFEVKELNRGFDKVTLNLNYYRFNDDYSEWDVWSWIDGSEGAGYEFATENDYGKVATIVYEGVENKKSNGIGVIVRKPDWSSKDIDNDRFIDLAYANNKGEINAYLVQSNADIVFNAKDAVKDPAINIAKIDSSKEISFITNVKVPEGTTAKVIATSTGKDIGVKSLTINEDGISGKIEVKSAISLNEEYTVEFNGYIPKVATLGKIYGSDDFKDLYHFDGELGALYSKDKTNFVLWSPLASKVELALYPSGNDSEAEETIKMTKGEKGIWTAEVAGDLNGKYYTYLVNNNGSTKEVTDPYAKAVGVNGKRAMVIDMATTNPEGWDKDTKPEMLDPTDAIIYELHIRDFTIDKSAGSSVEVQGKYEGVWQSGTTLLGNGDIKTGIDHLKELGITHLHLLPTFDHRSIDETKLDTPQFNWGYDPQNYNTPEGSYSSDPYKAEIRIKEFKEMVMELHKAGIRVVMDVVYNHTGASADSHLNYAVPDYYYRQNDVGAFSNGSGCGNEIASERSMVSKMIVESVVYWAEEYHIDGFRFDLMGLHDINTMKTIRTELDKIDESIIMYGEGWTGGESPLPIEEQAVKLNTIKYDKMQIAAFSDDMRDGIKGHVFESGLPGFINGYEGLKSQIQFGIVASTENDQVALWQSKDEYEGYSAAFWANEPYQTVNYASAHDNLTLWDKLQTTNPDASKEELMAMNKMSAALVLTSQGIPFFHAGEEMARTKVNEDGTFNHNSYNASDSVNAMDWTRKEEYSELFEYYKGLIELRKSHDSFKMDTTEQIQNGLEFLKTDKNSIAYTLDGTKVNDAWDNIAVVFNSNEKEIEVELPSKDWVVVVNEKTAGIKKLDSIKGNKVKVPAKASYVLVDANSFGDGPSADSGNTTGIVIAMVAGIAVVAAGTVAFVVRKKKKNK